MSRKFLIAALAIIIFAVIAYAWLGGFTPLNYQLVGHPALNVSGKEFHGAPGEDALEDLFYEMQERAVNLDTTLIVITYPEADTTELIRQFIGVPIAVPADSLEVRRFPAGEYVMVTLSNDMMVTPSPGNVLAEAREFAVEKGRRLSGESIEVYSEFGDPKVLFPLAD